MARDDVAYVDAGGPAFSLNRSVSHASSCSSSSSNSEMKPWAMARSMGAQKNAARHRMTKRDYEMIVTYLENPDNFAAINGGVIMGKKVARYVCTYKNARTFYLSTGSGLTEAEIDAGLTLEQKMNAKCHYFVRMHALFGARANVEPLAVGDAGLPAELVFDVPGLCQDSQAAFQFSTAEPMLSGDEEEAADREEEPIDLSGNDEVDNQTAPVANGDDYFETAKPDVTCGAAFFQTACAAEDGGPGMGNQSGRSAVDVETNAVKEKLVLRKEAQDQKASFRDAILEDRRQAREQRARIQEEIEAMRRARADRRSTLLAEMVKTRKSMDEIHQAFLLLDSVEESLSDSM
ncbi:hypothetical protein R1sor_024248 [Riccia sorocarpa]|uniref:Uncharacterized protein n=1 Tax=Riccia sorocarpa TaxID=122646 RepID=A0ABD3GSY3_9MARC